MKSLFAINARFHGAGKVLFAWQPGGNYLATAGTNGRYRMSSPALSPLTTAPWGLDCWRLALRLVRLLHQCRTVVALATLFGATPRLCVSSAVLTEHTWLYAASSLVGVAN